MKKIFLIIAIAFANSVFTSCTDLDEDLENKPLTEVSATDGEEGQDPEEEEDPANGG